MLEGWLAHVNSGRHTQSTMIVPQSLVWEMVRDAMIGQATRISFPKERASTDTTYRPPFLFSSSGSSSFDSPLRSAVDFEKCMGVESQSALDSVLRSGTQLCKSGEWRNGESLSITFTTNRSPVSAPTA